MTREERKHVQAIIKYNRGEIIYDKFAYDRMRNAYRDWLKNLLRYGHPEPKAAKRRLP